MTPPTIPSPDLSRLGQVFYSSSLGMLICQIFFAYLQSSAGVWWAVKCRASRDWSHGQSAPSRGSLWFVCVSASTVRYLMTNERPTTSQPHTSFGSHTSRDWLREREARSCANDGMWIMRVRQRGEERTRVTTENVQVPKPASYMGEKRLAKESLLLRLSCWSDRSHRRIYFVLIADRGWLILWI